MNYSGNACWVAPVGLFATNEFKGSEICTHLYPNRYWSRTLLRC